MYKDVFISHAKEDSEFADQIYDFLTNNGYSPWLDKRKLKVGMNWDYEIKQALKNSHFVIILLSSKSVNKRGYIQKEFKYALDYSENKLIDDIYIIPILLDQCEVPDQLSRFQWIEANNHKLNECILDSLNIQRKKYLDTLPKESIDLLNDCKSISIQLNLDTKNEIDFNCIIPVFESNVFFDAHFINAFIHQLALKEVNNFRRFLLEEEKASGYLEIGYNIAYLTKDYLSISLVTHSYYGGAYPNVYFETLNFRFNPEIIITLNDLIKIDNLSEFLVNSINNYGSSEQIEYLIYYVKYINEFNLNFTFNDKTLFISFTNHIPHAITALGFLEIPFNHLKLKSFTNI